MLRRALLCLCTLQIYSAVAQNECTDLRGRLIAHGLHYVPGPDTCTLCVCDNGMPKVCKAVLCSPPQDCRSFRVGHTCCEFICLDDVVKPPAEGGESGVRLAAGGAAAAVLLTVALVVYRVRRQKRRRAPHADDQRSLTSIGYISGSMGYMGGTCETALGAWKPPGNYMPRGEAPPPYEEVVAQCRQEGNRMGSEAFHRSYPATLEALPRPDDCAHGYANMPRPPAQIPNPATCYTAPLVAREPGPGLGQAGAGAGAGTGPGQSPRLLVFAADSPDGPASMQRCNSATVMGFPGAIRLTGSLGAISNRGLLSLLQRPPPASPPYHAAAPAHAKHRTIPRLGGAGGLGGLGGLGGAVPLPPSPCALSRAAADVRRSFHRPAERGPPGAAGAAGAAAAGAAGRSMPRNLNLAHTHHAPERHDLRAALDIANMRPMPRPRAAEDPPPPAQPPSAPHPPHPPHPPPADCAPSSLPLTVDKPSCECSYVTAGATEGAEGAAGEDADDYRSECENCKAATASRWAVAPSAPESEEGTQTLQRRAPAPNPPPAATATLPQPVTRQPRTILGPPSNWENWFNTIPDSDTESEEE